MNILLLILSVVTAEYIRLLGTGKWLGVNSKDASVRVVQKDFATKFKREQSGDYPDKVIISHSNGERRLYISNNTHLKSTSNKVNTPFEILLTIKNKTSGFILKSKTLCLLYKNAELRFGNCKDSNIAYLAISEEITGTKLDGSIKYDGSGRKETPEPPKYTQLPLTWAMMTGSDLYNLLDVFNREKCERKCPIYGERVFVKFNKF